MNFLAHIYLSGEDDQLKIGNFIADSVKGKQYLNYPEKIQKGIILHRAIDNFTDTHPIVRKSIRRLHPIYHHYSGVIIDIFYDHFLAANWGKYSKQELQEYIANFYNLLERSREQLPQKVQNFLPIMVKYNWLLSYRSIEGIGKILFQMEQRTKFESNLHLSIKELKEYYPEFENEFKDFFEELRKFVKEELEKLKD